MGRPRLNEEDRVRTFTLNVKGYILDNINNDKAAMNEIYAFIESKWGDKDEDRYENQRKERRIILLKKDIETSKARLVELETKYGVKSELYRMMSPALVKKIKEAEIELTLAIG